MHGVGGDVLALGVGARARWLLLVFVLLFQPAASALAAGSEFGVAPTPSWVRPVLLDVSAQPQQSQVVDGVHYVLSDIQVRVGKADRTMFRHVVTRALSERGVQSLGHVEIGFDPSYQTLTLHGIRVHRAGREPANKLVASSVKVLQREKDLDYRILDGTKTANVFLDDVRVGDTIEYAYSVTGSNPVLANREFGRFDLQWGVPVAQVYRRIVVPAGRDLHLKLRNTNQSPRIIDTNEGREYIWEFARQSALQVESDAPSWFDPYASVQWTEFDTWGAVARWAEPLYRIPERSGPAVQNEIDRIARSTQDPGERMLAALRFVQGEVRYLGVEVGSGSYAPNRPQVVLERRFGDCKDKTLLTATLLRGLGIEARPALVHTSLRRGVAEQSPSPGAFNLVIVRARVGGNDYWLDPTRSVQRGDLSSLNQADYGPALIVDLATQGLTQMPDAALQPNKRTIGIAFDMREGYDKPVRMTVTTVSLGASADSVRSMLSSQSREELQKRYLNFYARYYPKITVAQPWQESDDPHANQTTLVEQYWVEDVWKRSDEKNRNEFTLHPADLYQQLERPQQSIRTAPLSVPHPVDVVLTTSVDLPDDWNIKSDRDQVADPAFEFEQTVDATPRRVTMTDRFRSRTDVVEAADVARYSANLRKANDALGYRLFRNDRQAVASPSESAFSRLGFVPMMLGGLFLALWLWLAWKLYQYDPEPQLLESTHRWDPIRGIGGWLILAALNVIATPIVMLAVMGKVLPSYAGDVWGAVTTAGSSSYHHLWAPLLTFELAANLALLVFSVLLAVLFFKRRSSVPRIFVGFLAVVCATQAVDMLLMSAIPAAAADKPPIGEFARSAIALVLWGGYFMRSRRVRATFVERHRSAPSAVCVDASAPA